MATSQKASLIEKINRQQPPPPYDQEREEKHNTNIGHAKQLLIRFQS